MRQAFPSNQPLLLLHSPSPAQAMVDTKGNATARPRGGKTRSRNLSTRHKEDAEVDRKSAEARAIPRYSHRFMLFRPNRRQRAKQLSEEVSSPPQSDAAIFSADRFSDLPLSGRTLDGLAAANFSHLTPIQRLAIPQALAERDVLAAAPTGSGKTLAFLVPLLESLWRHKWNTFDALGALILAPTRELSIQIFDVLRSVARRHTISAGLIIGGKDFNAEREKVGNMNVLVGTPGRVLHHMDHVAELDCSALKLVVLDEADRILDMGFASTLDAIMKNLPRDRQTLLFSATQTKDIKALARLSLQSPEYVSVHSRPTNDAASQVAGDDGAESKAAANGDDKSSVSIVGTPIGLSQSYAVVARHEKLSVLWSFIRTHLKAKMIIFLSSGKQVRFVFEAFCKLRPGMSLLHIHGGMKQSRRTEMYDAFCRTRSAALFATDVAGRGLDFPDVEWIIQVDCPDDVGTYVHRVGRTARFKAHGKAMLLLCSGKEETFLQRLSAKKLELHHTKINPKRITSIDKKLAAIVASSQELRHLAQRAFAFYVKSVYQQSDKDVFDVTEMDFDALAKSLGMSIAPKVSIKAGANGVQKSSEAKLKTKTVFGYDTRHMTIKGEDDEDVLGDLDDDVPRKRAKNALGKRARDAKDAKVAPAADVDDADILTVKKVHEAEDDEVGAADIQKTLAAPVQRKRKVRKLDLFKGLPSSQRVVFDEDGNRVQDEVPEFEKDGAPGKPEHTGIDEYAQSVRLRLVESDRLDKQRERDRVRALHTKRRRNEKELNKRVRPNADGAEEIAVLAGAMPSDEEDEDGGGVGSSLPSSEEEDGVRHSEVSDEETRSADVRGDEELALQILRSRR